MLDIDHLSHLDALAGLDFEDYKTLSESANLITLPQGQKVFQMGQDCGAFIFLIRGCVRVHMTGETGREIVLYRVEEGQTCILTTACLLSNEVYNADAICEEPCEALVVSAPVFNRLLATSETFRNKVFENYSTRLTTLMGLIEEVAFSRMDQRLAQVLLNLDDKHSALEKTHNELAVELGTAREVISRLLKDFEKKGIILLSRGHIQILDQGALEKIILR